MQRSFISRFSPGFICSSLILFALFSFSLVSAQSGAVSVTNCNPETQLCNPLRSQTLDQFVERVTTAAVRIGVPIAALFIIWAGFKFVTARGNPEGLKQAKSIFWWTIIGTAVLLAASLLANVLSTSVNQLNL